RALALAKEHGASITLVHAIDPDMWRLAVRATPRNEFPDDEALLRGTYSDMLAQFNKEHLEGLAKEHLTHGSPTKAIADHARLHHADLIVVGTHGTHGIERMLLGAHAEAIIEHAPCSVLVVR
ncbi:MAG: universal stress protein, partial [Candidatus Thermoplasmatota archaeon]